MYKRNLTIRKLKMTLENGEIFFETESLEGPRLERKGISNDKSMKDDKRNLPDEWRALLNRACYLYGNDQTRKYSFETNKRKKTKGLQGARTGVTTSGREEAKRKRL